MTCKQKCNDGKGASFPSGERRLFYFNLLNKKDVWISSRNGTQNIKLNRGKNR